MITTTTTEKLTVDEVFESLTGFDELAIAKAFGISVGALIENTTQATTLMRAMVFVQRRRAGQTDVEAKQTVMETSLKEIQESFADDPEEIDPEAPDTEVGKGDGPSDSQPVSLPPSVS